MGEEEEVVVALDEKIEKRIEEVHKEYAEAGIEVTDEVSADIDKYVNQEFRVAFLMNELNDLEKRHKEELHALSQQYALHRRALGVMSSALYKDIIQNREEQGE